MTKVHIGTLFPIFSLDFAGECTCAAKIMLTTPIESYGPRPFRLYTVRGHYMSNPKL